MGQAITPAPWFCNIKVLRTQRSVHQFVMHVAVRLMHHIGERTMQAQQPITAPRARAADQVGEAWREPFSDHEYEMAQELIKLARRSRGPQ
jgi:hypothetical protein